MADIGVTWAGTVHHGLPPERFAFSPERGDYLAFLGRLSPEKQPDVAIDPLVVEAKTMQDFAGIGFKSVSTEVVVFLLDLSKAWENPIHVFRSCRVRQRMLQLFELVVQIADASAARTRSIAQQCTHW